MTLKDSHAMELSRHFLKEFYNVQALPIHEVHEAKFQWLPIDEVEAMENEKKSAIANIHGEWKEAIAPDGRTYYWYMNFSTGYF